MPNNIQYILEWRKRNPEKVKLYRKRWREKNKDIIGKYHGKYMKEWRKKNPEKIVEYRKRHRAKYPERYKMTLEIQRRLRKYRKNCREKRLRFEILKRDNFTCQYCGRDVKEDKVKLHIDHVIPKSKKGNNLKENLITACSDCNYGKSDVLLSE